MLLSKWDEEQRRAVAGTLTSPGWQLLKEEFELRKKRLIHGLVYSTDRAQDDVRRAMAVAIDELIRTEKELFSPPSEGNNIFTIPELPTGNRY